MKYMIQTCTFKSQVHHSGLSGCNLTADRIPCPDEENCVLFQTYVLLHQLHEKEKNEGKR